MFGDFLDEMQKELSDEKRVPLFFAEDERLNEDILKCLVFIEENQDEVMERILSSRLYGNSKYFERNVKGKVISILKYWKRRDDEDVLEEQELLGEQGIVRWPEVMEFTGNIKVLLKSGDVIDYGFPKYGAYINSNTVKQIKEVVFHGGCYSPVKGAWFRKIYEGSRKKNETIRYFHWSDIDIGGFRIFRRLKEAVVPQLQPYKMDEDTFMEFRESAVRIGTSSYGERLKAMGKDSAYEEFWKVIERMIQWDSRLEQESLIAGR